MDISLKDFRFNRHCLATCFTSVRQFIQRSVTGFMEYPFPYQYVTV